MRLWLGERMSPGAIPDRQVTVQASAPVSSQRYEQVAAYALSEAAVEACTPATLGLAGALCWLLINALRNAPDYTALGIWFPTLGTIDLAGYLAFGLVPILAHEPIHALAMALAGARPRIAFSREHWFFGYLYCQAQGLFSRTGYLAVLLTPTVVTVAVCLVWGWAEPYRRIYLGFSLLGSFSMCLFDLWVGVQLLRVTARALVEHRRTGFAAFRPPDSVPRLEE